MSVPFHIGQRLSYSGHLCTVRYIGKVQGTTGEWLGVEWDDPSRGKHDGERDGIRYFECARRTSSSASFVRPNRQIDLPRSFVEALKYKYASETIKLSESGTYEKKAVVGHGDAERAIQISGKEVEEVGFDKIRMRLANVAELRIVLLDGLLLQRPVNEQMRQLWNTSDLRTELQTGLLAAADPVRQPGRQLDVRLSCPNVMELDLSRNLFEEWVEICSICDELFDLRSLRCDGNRFRSCDLTATEHDYFKFRFGTIDNLSLTDVLMSWEELAGVASLFRNIVTFTASCNQLRTLRAVELPRTLTNIVLEDNAFKSLSDVAALRSLPNLHKLILRNNHIRTILPPDGVSSDGDSVMSLLPRSLSHLDLSNNDIVQWSFISELPTAAPGLTSLRISNNPLYQSLHSAEGLALTPDDGYILTIARLKNLTALNYSAITEKDRLNAETYYLSQIAASISRLPLDSSVESYISEHPRYKELCEEYGEPAILRKGPATNPNSLATRLIRLELIIEGRESITIEVPKRLSVYAVQGIVGKALGIAPATTHLVWKTNEMDPLKLDQTSFDEWVSDSESEEEPVQRGLDSQHKMREVEILPGTRSIGTWIDGDSAALSVTSY